MGPLLPLFIDEIVLHFQLELLAAKNLIGANLNGTSDPYAIITCGTEKRFRSFFFFFTFFIRFFSCAELIRDCYFH